MNDSIDQNVYENLHARVNDGDNGRYGINNPLERLDSSRDQIVLAWDQDEPLMINTDLNTCQQCGSKMRNAGGKQECNDKRCDKCGWSVTKDGFPTLVNLDHAYPNANPNGDMDKATGEAVPGYTTEQHRLNEEAHMYRSRTPDTSVQIANPQNHNRLATDDDLLEGFDGGIISNLGTYIALVIFAARVMSFNNSGRMPPMWQLVLELCTACFFSWVYVILVALMYSQYYDQGEIVITKDINLIVKG
jgi:hypothetical protein